MGEAFRQKLRAKNGWAVGVFSTALMLSALGCGGEQPSPEVEQATVTTVANAAGILACADEGGEWLSLPPQIEDILDTPHVAAALNVDPQSVLAARMGSVVCMTGLSGNDIESEVLLTVDGLPDGLRPLCIPVDVDPGSGLPPSATDPDQSTAKIRYYRVLALCPPADSPT